MILDETGVLEYSERYFSTPSSFAARVFFYVTRLGHYYTNRQYQFSSKSILAQEPTHNRHFCMVFIKEGCLQASLDQHELTAPAGTVFLYDCKRPHSYFSTSDQTELLWMCFDGISAAQTVQQLIIMNGSSPLFLNADTSGLEHFFLRILSDYQTPTRTSESLISEQVYGALCRLLQQRNPSGGYGDSCVTAAMHFMDLHLREQIHITDVAKQIGLSVSQLTKSFRRQTGYSPYEYLTLQRISRAKGLLASTTMTIHCIAEICGYNSEANFIRTFSHHVGQTPGAFRRDPV